MASGNYDNAGSGQPPTLNTNLAGITPTANTLTLPSNVTSLPRRRRTGRLRPHPTVSGSIPSLPDSRLNVNMQRVLCGK